MNKYKNYTNLQNYLTLKLLNIIIIRLYNQMGIVYYKSEICHNIYYVKYNNRKYERLNKRYTRRFRLLSTDI